MYESIPVPWILFKKGQIGIGNLPHLFQCRKTTTSWKPPNLRFAQVTLFFAFLTLRNSEVSQQNFLWLYMYPMGSENCCQCRSITWKTIDQRNVVFQRADHRTRWRVRGGWQLAGLPKKQSSNTLQYSTFRFIQFLMYIATLPLCASSVKNNESTSLVQVLNTIIV